jgi:hypothetical protein
MLSPYTASIEIFQRTKVLLLFLSRTKIYFTKGKNNIEQEKHPIYCEHYRKSGLFMAIHTKHRMGIFEECVNCSKLLVHNPRYDIGASPLCGAGISMAGSAVAHKTNFPVELAIDYFHWFHGKQYTSCQGWRSITAVSPL